jgi:hypothetical protein
MSVKINVTDNEPNESEDVVKIKIQEKDRIEAKIIYRDALNGDIMILDHKDIDIVVNKTEKKIITFAKEMMSDAVYGAESRLLEYLRRAGVIEYDSIQGGNVYGSMEGRIQNSEKHDPIKVTLFKIAEWLDTERPYITGVTAYDQIQDDAILEPDNEYSTELGDVPADERKGSINHHNMFAPYLYGRYTY